MTNTDDYILVVGGRIDRLTPEDLVHRLIGSYVPMEPHK